MSENIFIIGIDPGTNTGVAIYELSPIDFSIISIDTVTINLSMHHNMLEKLLTVRSVIERLIFNYHPHIIGMEAAFLNIRFPKAVMQLSQLIGAMELTAKTIDPNVKLLRYPPKAVKKIIGAGGNADKDDMLKNIKNFKEITNNINVDLLTEHEIDALSIGYIVVNEIRNYPFILYAIGI